MEIEVFVEICREDAILPSYAKPGDAGMDVCAAENIDIGPGETVIIPTGIKLAIPEGYEIQVRPRSGISFKTPLRISNSPGTIDSGYRDELGIIMTNTSQLKQGDGSKQGDDSPVWVEKQENRPLVSVDTLASTVEKQENRPLASVDALASTVEKQENHPLATEASVIHKNRPHVFAEFLTIGSSGNKPGIYKISKGDRIAQIVLQEIPRMKLTVVDSVSKIGENRGGGFGSTGVR